MSFAEEKHQDSATPNVPVPELQVKLPSPNVFTESATRKQDTFTQTTECTIQSTEAVQSLDVSTQSTSAAINIDELGTQSSRECILSAHALSRFPEHVLFSNKSHKHVNKSQFSQFVHWRQYIHHLENGLDEVRQPSSPVSQSVNETEGVAVICKNQMFQGFSQHHLANANCESKMQDLKSIKTPHLYKPVEIPRYTAAPPPWSPNPTLFMTYNEPPAYNECVEPLVDTPSAYRSFQQQTQLLLKKKREKDASSLQSTGLQGIPGSLSDHPGKSDYQALAFLSCLFCWPVGLVAIYYSNMCCIERSAGNVHQANLYSKLAFNTSLAALVFGVLGYFVLCIYQSVIFF